MGDPAAIHHEIVAVVARVAGAEAGMLAPATSLYDLGVDSLTVMEIVAELEERLAIQLPDSNAFVAGLRTVADLEAAFAVRLRER
jgi:acyl carrier protein